MAHAVTASRIPNPDGPLSELRHRQHRAWGEAEQLERDAAERTTDERAVAVGGDDDQVGLELRGRVGDQPGRAVAAAHNRPQIGGREAGMTQIVDLAGDLGAHILGGGVHRALVGMGAVKGLVGVNRHDLRPAEVGQFGQERQRGIGELRAVCRPDDRVEHRTQLLSAGR